MRVTVIAKVGGHYRSLAVSSSHEHIYGWRALELCHHLRAVFCPRDQHLLDLELSLALAYYEKQPPPFKDESIVSGRDEPIRFPFIAAYLLFGYQSYLDHVSRQQRDRFGGEDDSNYPHKSRALLLHPDLAFDQGNNTHSSGRGELGHLLLDITRNPKGEMAPRFCFLSAKPLANVSLTEELYRDDDPTLWETVRELLPTLHQPWCGWEYVWHFGGRDDPTQTTAPTRWMADDLDPEEGPDGQTIDPDTLKDLWPWGHWSVEDFRTHDHATLDEDLEGGVAGGLAGDNERLSVKRRSPPLLQAQENRRAPRTLKDQALGVLVPGLLSSTQGDVEGLLDEPMKISGFKHALRYFIESTPGIREAVRSAPPKAAAELLRQAYSGMEEIIWVYFFGPLPVDTLIATFSNPDGKVDRRWEGIVDFRCCVNWTPNAADHTSGDDDRATTQAAMKLGRLFGSLSSGKGVSVIIIEDPGRKSDPPLKPFYDGWNIGSAEHPYVGIRHPGPNRLYTSGSLSYTLRNRQLEGIRSPDWVPPKQDIHMPVVPSLPIEPPGWVGTSGYPLSALDITIQRDGDGDAIVVDMEF
ncbi:hypothetical protein QBC35DRAFT_550846 [Podospora australis]|uniref:Uncharacterized protein n=1 Tax=Podospora australis TaxID=1536484 RepID=A0AAN6WTI3_9PEZI|nr:hypothetical protein QBC35DRAFT_550846 [Podospora australis]